MLPFFRKIKKRKHNIDKQNNILLMMVKLETKPKYIRFYLGDSERIFFENKKKHITLTSEQPKEHQE